MKTTYFRKVLSSIGVFAILFSTFGFTALNLNASETGVNENTLRNSNVNILVIDGSTSAAWAHNTTFEIFDVNAQTYTYENYIAGEGVLTVSLPAGDYKICQVSTVSGYNPEEGLCQDVTVSGSAGNMYTLTYTQVYYESEVTITLKDSETGALLSGAEFYSYTDETQDIQFTELAGFYRANIPGGTHDICQTKAPTGYILPESPSNCKTVNLSTNSNETLNMEFFNDKSTESEVEFLVANGEDEPISEVEINLYKDGSYYSTITSSTSAETLMLPVGEYSACQEVVSPGYINTYINGCDSFSITEEDISSGEVKSWTYYNYVVYPPYNVSVVDSDGMFISGATISAYGYNTATSDYTDLEFTVNTVPSEMNVYFPYAIDYKVCVESIPEGYIMPTTNCEIVNANATPTTEEASIRFVAEKETIPVNFTTIDKDTSELVSGADFILYSNNLSNQVFISQSTSNDGTMTYGLDEGDYIIEMYAPDGYYAKGNQLLERYYFTIDSETSSVDYEFEISKDTDVPIITFDSEQVENNTVSISQNSTFNPMDYISSAFDFRDGNITDNVVVASNNVNTSIPGTYYVNYEVTDNAGNTGYATLTVIVSRDIDNITPITPEFDMSYSPTIKFVDDETGEPLDVAYTLYSQNEQGGIDQVLLTGTSTLDGFQFKAPVGTYTLMYTTPEGYVGFTGNPGTFGTAISVNDGVSNTDAVYTLFRDTSIPVITPIESAEDGITVIQDSTFVPMDYILKAEDELDGDITSSIIVAENTVDTSVLGTYYVTYSVTNSIDKTGTLTLPVKVVRDLEGLDTTTPSAEVDNTPPIIELSETEVTLLEGSLFSAEDYLVKAYDTVGGETVDLTGEVTIYNNINTGVPGSYTAVYSVSDGRNTTQEILTVNIVRDTDNYTPVTPGAETDNTPPVIELSNSEVTIVAGSIFSPEIYLNGAHDTVGTEEVDLTDRVVISSNVDSGVPGTYTVTYTVSDGRNTTEETLIVHVVRDTDGYTPVTPDIDTDNTAPVVTLSDSEVTILEDSTFVPEDYLVEGYDIYNTEKIDMTDRVVISSDINSSEVGTYTVSYTLSDGRNTTIETLTVYVVRDTDNITPVTPGIDTDNTPPVIVLNETEVTITEGEGFNPEEYLVEAYDMYNTEKVDLTDDVIISSNVNTGVPGKYTVTYTVSDGRNETTATLNVNVNRDLDTYTPLTPEVDTAEPEVPDRDIDKYEPLTPEVDTVEPEPEVPDRDIDGYEPLTPEVDSMDNGDIDAPDGNDGGETEGSSEITEDENKTLSETGGKSYGIYVLVAIIVLSGALWMLQRGKDMDGDEKEPE